LLTGRGSSPYPPREGATIETELPIAARPRLRRVVCAFALLIHFGGFSEATRSGEPVVSRTERAVVTGDLEALRALRSTVLDRLESMKSRAPAGDRYDLAYLDWRISQLLRDAPKKQRKTLLKEAQRQLDLVLDQDPGHAEAHALRGSVIGERIEGMFGGILLGRKASSSLKRANALDPTNPRVALQRGIGFYFTPKSFGGGLNKAEQELRRALDLFRKEKPDKTWPNWGRVDALAWLGQVLADAGRVSEARKLYREALTLEPDHVWIRDELLPALK